MKHAIVLTSLLLLAAPAWARAGADPLYEPVVIGSSGRYVVTRAFSGTNPIQVAGDGVDIDLNGFTITSTSGPVISIADGVTDVSIHGGHLTGGSDGILHLATSVASRLRVEAVDIDGTGYGIRVATLAGRVTIAGCNLDDLSEEGIHLETTLPASTFSITDTRLTSIAKNGISVDGFRGGEISHCSVVRYGSGLTNAAGIMTPNTDGALIRSNTVNGGWFQTDGIVVDARSRVTGNAVVASLDQIRAANSDVIDHNNTDGPIRTLGFGDTLLENSDFNLFFALLLYGGVYRDNNAWTFSCDISIAPLTCYDAGDNP